MWVCAGPAPGPDHPWPLAVLEQIVIAFSAPGDHVIVLDIAHSAVEAGETLADAQAAVQRLDRTPCLVRQPGGTARDSATRPTEVPGDLVITTVSPHTVVDDQLGWACAQLLRPGGVLAVLTHSATVDARLVDPTGALVTACQHADLLYLQHIVTLHTDWPSRPVDHDGARQHRVLDRRWIRPHPRIHGDLVVFAKPRTTGGPR